jgi:hypothetical protein
MQKNYVKFYPVGNGDQSLICLEDGTTILVDCNIRQDSVNSSDSKIFDVKKDLLSTVQRRNGIPYADVFILTHGDCDHCRGYQYNFYQGDPQKYSDKNKAADEILIDEMWFSPMIAEEHTNDDEQAYQLEAERRLDLHRKNDPNKDIPGNRIKIVGYDGNKDYSDLNHLRAIPGTVVSVFNNKSQSIFSIFIHAPFKEHLTSIEKDKNSTSIVFQARFKSNSLDSKFSGLFMFGGDSDHLSWKIILDKTKKYGNDKKEQALNWDVFLSPHHCSWSFFNDRPQENNPEPKPTSLEVLDYKRDGAHVIASSKKIVNDDDNPPHYQAKMEYIKKVGAFNFFNTATEPSETKPQPIAYIISTSGISKETSSLPPEDEKKAAAAIKIASSGLIKKPWSR